MPPARRRTHQASWLSMVLLVLCFAATPLSPADAQQAAEPEAETGESELSSEPAAETGESEGPPDLPAPVIDPDISEIELTLRLIPLTRDELAAAAEEWLAVVKEKSQQIVELRITLLEDGEAANDAVRDRLTQLSTERHSLFDKYAIVLDSWQKKGGDPAEIEPYRAYRASVLLEQARTSDWRTLVEQGFAWLIAPEGGMNILINTAIILAAIVALFAVARIVRGFAGRGISRIPNLSKLLQSFLTIVVYWLTLAIGLMIVLSALGIDVTPVFALIGGASFIMAFALQDTLGNLAAGLMIMINRPFDEGDYVDIGGVAGTVQSVSIVSTKVTTPDNQVIIVPNSEVWGNVITNVTSSPTRRVDLTFGIAYEDSIPEALAVMERVVRAHPAVLADPEPMIEVNELADSSVKLICRPWVKGSDYWTVYWDLTRHMKLAFDEAGLTIPFPQQELHIRTADRPHASHISPASPPPRDGAPIDQAAGDEGHDTSGR